MENKNLTQFLGQTKFNFCCFLILLFTSTVIANGEIGISNNSISKQDSSDLFSDKIAIEQIVEQWKNRYNNGDASKVADLYAEDVYYLTQHFVTGIVKGKKSNQSLC